MDAYFQIALKQGGGGEGRGSVLFHVLLVHAV